MAITPSVLIAASGFTKGQGLGVNSSMLSQFNSFTTNPVTGSLSSFGSLGSSLPTFMTQSSSQISAVTSQASNILPSGIDGLKKFTTIMNQSAGFGAAAAEWGAALKEFGGKSFSDMGVNVASFSSMASNGISGALGNLPKLPSGAGSSTAFAKVASSVQDNLGALGKSLSGLGNLFDVKNPGQIGNPAALIKNLNAQGLGNVGGLQDKVFALGYDFETLDDASPEELNRVLTSIQGSDLQKIVKQTGLLLPSGASLNNLGDALNPRNLLGDNVMKVIPGGNFSGLGNMLTNIGGNFKNFGDIGGMIGKMEVPSLPKLDGLKELVPAEDMLSFKDILGQGDSPLGLPTMEDMLGSVSGKSHMDNFRDIAKSMEKIAESVVGKDLVAKGAAVNAAKDSARSEGIALGYSGSELEDYVNNSPAVTTALSDAQSSITAFNQQATGNADLRSLVEKSNKALSASTSQLSKEVSNLSLAGIDVGGAEGPPGIGSLLGMANKLHTFGVDKQKLGFASMFEGLATDSVYGDAIKSALMEGRNLARQSKAAIPAPTKADPAKTLASSLPAADPTKIEWYPDDAESITASMAKANGMKNEINTWLESNPDASEQDQSVVNQKLAVLESQISLMKGHLTDLG